LIARERVGDLQAEKEREQLLNRLANLSLLPDNATLDDVLALEVDSMLGRRLQTIVLKKGLANTAKQARQFIIHGHTSIGDRKVTIPGYLVKKHEEETIEYNANSPIANDLHPMRPKPKLGGFGGESISTAEPAAESKDS
ncbi:MAG: 30S ribosomal protein S4, partial [Thermoplasmata archaeon]|nr:30S ribosomal protein S4 [Thermoplasmata archaeon]